MTTLISFQLYDTISEHKPLNYCNVYHTNFITLNTKVVVVAIRTASFDQYAVGMQRCNVTTILVDSRYLSLLIGFFVYFVNIYMQTTFDFTPSVCLHLKNVFRNSTSKKIDPYMICSQKRDSNFFNLHSL